MVGAFIAGIGLLLVLGLFGRWFVGVEPRQLLAVGRWLIVVLAVVLLIALVATGRGSFALGLLVMLSPFLRPVWRRLQAVALQARIQGGSGDQTSTLETRTLRMSLDHRSGDLDGEIIVGAFAGRRLSDLTLPELAELMRACAVSDTQSLPLLETFADRRFPGWRDASEDQAEPSGADTGAGDSAAGAPGPGRMSRDDAYRILGLAPGASDDDVRAAYHRLIKVLHPDQGGSSLLAAQVNRARDRLLDRGKAS